VAEQLFRQWDGVRYDVFTTLGAIEEIQTHQPRVLFVALGETDDWAHEGHYDRYLNAARRNDESIRMLWDTTQAYPVYRNQTLFLITSDHGRGNGRQEWRGHGKSYPGSERCWIAAFGSHLEASGIDRGGSYELAQIAATVAAYLGHDFTAAREGVHSPLPIVTPVAEPSSPR
jgi:bisphosphoglycerate-independent phosphoglycerate mutase (AlkP superfamily)